MHFDLANKSKRIEELEREMEASDFWDHAELSQKKMKELKSLKDDIETYHNLETHYDDIETLIMMAEEENDASLIPEIGEAAESYERIYDAIRIKTLLSGEFDADAAIVSLNAGAGGTESCDWASMLYRMYTRWANAKGFSVEVLDFHEGDEAGIKSVTFQVNGENAYGYLKSEKGVHRLVRISPFNAAGKRQTSFVSCDVMPDIEEDIDIEVRDEDIRIDTYRSSGAGGQHINKTESAIRITHLPTGMVVECQDERSQYKNKDKAMKVLRSRLYEQKQRAADESRAADRRAQVGSGDRSERIRTYNFPQGRVTDHRIGLTLYKIDSVLNGGLDELINPLRAHDQAEKLREEEN